MQIKNRRYIGCKTKLINNIYEIVTNFGFGPGNSFADVFAGTGVVGSYFSDRGFNVLFNDTLYSNFVIYNAYHGTGEIDENKIKKLIDYFNDIDSSKLKKNYFSDVYGNKYYSLNDSKKIGFIRDYIEDHRNELTAREYYYLITSLIYSIDKIANTVGHYESYLKKNVVDKGIILDKLEINKRSNPAEIYNMDANILAENIHYDVVYLDPPYNARQYVNFYHLIENLARWNKPTEFDGDSMKFKRDSLKSNYCRNTAAALLDDLIQKLDCRLIVVSYSNTYKAKSSSSINKISEEQMLEILQRKGHVNRIEINYNAFNSGKTDMKNHKEYLYVCEVN